MKKLKLFIILFCLLPFLLGNCNISTANISDVKMCDQMTDGQCSQDKVSFTTTTPAFYVSCNLNNAPSETEVTFSWYYNGDTKILVDEVTINSGDNGGSLGLHANLSIPDNGWPPGDYEVIIKIHTDNSKPTVKSFSVD